MHGRGTAGFGRVPPLRSGPGCARRRQRYNCCQRRRAPGAPGSAALRLVPCTARRCLDPAGAHPSRGYRDPSAPDRPRSPATSSGLIAPSAERTAGSAHAARRGHPHAPGHAASQRHARPNTDRSGQVRQRERMNSKVRLRGLGGPAMCGIPSPCASAPRAILELRRLAPRSRLQSAKADFAIVQRRIHSLLGRARASACCRARMRCVRAHRGRYSDCRKVGRRVVERVSARLRGGRAAAPASPGGRRPSGTRG